MPSNLENAIARRAAIWAELGSPSASSPVGKVDHSAAGRTFNFVGAKMSLYEELKELEKLITSLEGPIDDSVQGYA